MKKLVLWMMILLLTLSSGLPVLAEGEATTVVPTTPTTGAGAGTETGAGDGLEVNSGSANGTARTMLEFFRDDRTLDVQRVSKDEMMVYGVFLSNFYMPYTTKISDLVTDTGVSKNVSEQFFGSSGNTEKVKEINTKIYDSLVTGIGNSKERYGIYASKDDALKKAPMTGQQFLNKIAGKHKSMEIFNSEGKAVMNLNDPATRASFQVLFGISPYYMMAEQNGLRKMTSLYMDGFGNIWGAYGKAEVKDYVLFYPAVLNPVTFSGSTTGEFPVSNVFVTGATMKVTEDFLSGKGISTPYYNLKEYYPKNDVVTVFGVQSPSPFIGKLDSIVTKTGASLAIDKIKTSATQNNGDNLGLESAKVFISVDVSKSTDAVNALKTNGSFKSSEAANVLSYLTKTTMLSLDKVSSKMYYFNTGAGKTASDSSMGDWSQPESLILEQNLFNKATDGGFEFYSNSYMSSPFNKFYAEYVANSNKDSVLKAYLGGVDTKSDAYKSLKNLLDKGVLSGNDKVVKSALEMTLKGQKSIYSGYATSKYAQMVPTDTKWFFDTGKKPTGFGLTEADSSVTEASAYANKLTLFQKVTTKAEAPFGISGNSGFLSGVDSKGDYQRASALFYTLYSYRVFSMNSTYAKQLTGKSSGESYTTPFGKMTLKTGVANGVNHYPGMYWAYLSEMLGLTVNAEGQMDVSGYSNPLLPSMTIDVLGGQMELGGTVGSEGIIESEEKTMEQMQKDIVKSIYSLLSDEQSPYRDKWIKSTQDGWIVSTHRAITNSWVGANFSISAGNSNSYASTVGYINSPGLSDLPLANVIIQDYMYIYFFLLLLVLISLIMMCITHMRTIRESIKVFIIMAFVLIAPQFLVGNVINMSNMVGDKVYSERFNYWAITQHQQALTNVSSTIAGDDMDSIINDNMQKATNVYAQDSGVRVKWMAPKKDDMFETMFGDGKASQTLQSNLTIFKWLFSSYVYQEELVYDDPLATYLYRPYNALATEAQTNFDSFMTTKPTRKDVMLQIDTYRQNVLGIPKYKYALFQKPEGTIEYASDQKKLIDFVKPYKTVPTEEEASQYRYWGLTSKDVTQGAFRSKYALEDAGVDVNEDDKDYKAFALNSESPYYYFYNVLKYRYSTGSDDSSFKSALLRKEVFKVTDSPKPALNNTTRDFLDFEGLFTYVIPYHSQANDYVYGWTNIYGMSVDRYDFKDGAQPEGDVDVMEKYQDEQAKKEALRKVWKMYTPWVDQLYSQDVYSKRVSIGSDTEYVEDTLNPASYDASGRAMVFSQADMMAKSYNYSDLTETEMRIQRVLDETYEDLMYLINYRDFNDEALLTAGAMMATFNFNREFSEVNILGESSMLYPQGFELKNFNYDAFLRLVLLNTTGEPVMADKDLYVRVLEKTSWVTGVVIIIKDILGVFVIPAFRLITLLLLFFLTLVFSIALFMATPDKMAKQVIVTLGVPSAIYLGANILFAYIVSIFMGEGMTGYIGSRSADLSLTDPTMTLIVLSLVDLAYITVLLFLIKFLVSSLKVQGKTSWSVFSSLVSGAMSTVSNGVRNRAKGFGGSGGFGSGGSPYGGGGNGGSGVNSGDMHQDSQGLPSNLSKSREEKISASSGGRTANSDKNMKRWIDAKINGIKPQQEKEYSGDRANGFFKKAKDRVVPNDVPVNDSDSESTTESTETGSLPTRREYKKVRSMNLKSKRGKSE